MILTNSPKLRIQKNRLYRYDLLWRLNEYFNPAFPIAEGHAFSGTPAAPRQEPGTSSCFRDPIIRFPAWLLRRKPIRMDRVLSRCCRSTRAAIYSPPFINIRQVME